MTAQALAQYVRAADADMPRITQLFTAATDMVKKLVGTADVPDEVLEQAVLATGANLFARRTAQTDLSGYDNGLMQPIPQRPALDPLTPARNMLSPFLGPGIA